MRPEEAADWKAGPVAPAASLTLAAGADAQGQALERAIETAQRIAARGGHAVVLVDTLDGIAPAVARRALAAARAIVDGGSLTVIATATTPLGGETTVIGLDATRTAARNFPALDLRASGIAAPRAARGRRGRRRDRGGARRGRLAAGSAGLVGDPAPGGLGRQLDGLAVAVGLDVAEGRAPRARSARRARPP